MSNKDITYCNGDGCLLRNMCRRYVEGQRIKANRHGDTNQFYWTNSCNIDNRELFLLTN